MMNLQEISQALSNPTRINLIRMIGERPMSASDAHKRYIENYEDKKRESIYRELENLVDASLLTKSYNSNEKELQYRLTYEQLELNLIETEVTPTEDTQ